MSFRKNYGPCMCGADDCPRCYPQNFRNGQFIGDDEDDEDTHSMQDEEDFDLESNERDDEADDWGGMADGYGEPAE